MLFLKIHALRSLRALSSLERKLFCVHGPGYSSKIQKSRKILSVLDLTLGPHTSTGVSAFREVPNPLQNLALNFHRFLSKNEVSKPYCTLLFCFLKGRKVLNLYLCTIFLDSFAVHLTNPEAFEHGRCPCYLALSHSPSSVRNWRFVSRICSITILVQVWKGILIGVALQP